MKKLSKDQKKRKDELYKKLSDARENAETAVATFNNKVGEAYADYAKAIEDLNAILVEAREFAESVHSDMENYYNDKSERWQEGDAGQAYNDWLSEWSNIANELDEMNMEDQPELEEPSIEIDEFENLPEEPNS